MQFERPFSRELPSRAWFEVPWARVLRAVVKSAEKSVRNSAPYYCCTVDILEHFYHPSPHRRCSLPSVPYRGWPLSTMIKVERGVFLRLNKENIPELYRLKVVTRC